MVRDIFRRGLEYGKRFVSVRFCNYCCDYYAGVVDLGLGFRKSVSF